MRARGRAGSPRLLDGESGQSLVEVMTVGLLLFVPLLWAFGILSQLQAGALAATAAAREAGLDAARAGDLSQAGAAVDGAVGRAFVDQGLDADAALVHWDAPQGLMRGGIVEVEVAYRVPVLQAPLLGAVGGPGVWVRARHVARIDPYASRGP